MNGRRLIALVLVASLIAEPVIAGMPTIPRGGRSPDVWRPLHGPFETQALAPLAVGAFIRIRMGFESRVDSQLRRLAQRYAVPDQLNTILSASPVLLGLFNYNLHRSQPSVSAALIGLLTGIFVLIIVRILQACGRGPWPWRGLQTLRFDALLTLPVIAGITTIVSSHPIAHAQNMVNPLAALIPTGLMGFILGLFFNKKQKKASEQTKTIDPQMGFRFVPQATPRQTRMLLWILPAAFLLCNAFAVIFGKAYLHDVSNGPATSLVVGVVVASAVWHILRTTSARIHWPLGIILMSTAALANALETLATGAGCDPIGLNPFNLADLVNMAGTSLLAAEFFPFMEQIHLLRMRWQSEKPKHPFFRKGWGHAIGFILAIVISPLGVRGYIDSAFTPIAETDASGTIYIHRMARLPETIEGLSREKQKEVLRTVIGRDLYRAFLHLGPSDDREQRLRFEFLDRPELTLSLLGDLRREVNILPEDSDRTMEPDEVIRDFQAIVESMASVRDLIQKGDIGRVLTLLMDQIPSAEVQSKARDLLRQRWIEDPQLMDSNLVRALEEEDPQRLQILQRMLNTSWSDFPVQIKSAVTKEMDRRGIPPNGRATPRRTPNRSTGAAA
jgi:hypothetical protein